jgi:molecular chaperone IbpA
LKSTTREPFFRLPGAEAGPVTGLGSLAALPRLVAQTGGQDMRSALDFGNFRRSSVGFDQLFDMLENNNFGGESYPPFDLIRLDDNRYRIELAVAGFRREDIEITSQQNSLLVRGQKGDEDGSTYVHRGIANRAFERRFALADHIHVRGADLRDGMLSIDLEREIPEEMKPRRIDIGSSEAAQPQQTIEGHTSEPARNREPETV